MNKLTLVDTHTHFYPFCSFEEFFDYAYLNMQNAARDNYNAQPFSAILCLLETETSHNYQDLLDIATSTKKIGDWQLESLDQNTLFRVSQNNGKELYLLPGQQIITSENLELLIIGNTDKITYRKPIHSYLEKYGDTHLLIIPWGVGKWLGKRGRIVSQLIQNSDYKFALGDNSGRASLWKYVPQFNQARKKNIKILAGSDPLPIHKQYKKVATYGSALMEQLQPLGLAAQLRTEILNPTTNIKNYGRRDSLFRSISSQLLLRLKPITVRQETK